MNYLPRNKFSRQNHWKIISIVVFFLILSIFGFLFPDFSRTTAYTMAVPLWSVGEKIRVAFFSVKNFFVFKNFLIQKNLSLQDEVAGLKLKEMDYDALVKENNDLKWQFGREGNSTRVISAIISAPPHSPYDTLIIDTGSSLGIVSGDKVFLSDKIIIGEISSVTSHTSIVNLFSSSGQKQEAISLRTGASFELIGHGGLNFQFEVPKDTDIILGDTFSYPGLSQNIMANVYYIDSNSQSSFKTIYSRIPKNVFSSKYVFVEK